MKTSKDKRYKAVGYIRLSTDKQAKDDNNFEKQARKIRKACDRHGLTLNGIFEDTASGADPFGAVRRGGLIDAVSRARAEGAVLVIPEPTRLFRNVKAARDFLATLDVPIFSVRDGRYMKAPALLRAIERGEASVHAIRKGTAEALTRKDAQDVGFVEESVRSLAAKKSAKVRTQKSYGIAIQIAQILRSDRAYRDLSHEAFADLLNRNRIVSGHGRPWNRDSVRDQRKKAMELVEMMEEVDNSDDDLGNVVPVDFETGAQQLPPAGTQPARSQDAVKGVHKPLANGSDDADERAAKSEEEKMLNNPHFGMF